MNKPVRIVPGMQMSRREFLKLGGVGAGIVLLGACTPETATPSAAPAIEPTHITHVEATPGPSTAGGWAGKVLDRSGAPLANARVTLFSEDLAVFREVRKNAGGEYGFADVPAGNFTLGASALDYEYQEAPDAAGGLDFSLGADANTGRWQVIGDTEPEAFGGTNSGVYMPTSGEIIYCHDTIRPVVFNPITGTKRQPTPSPSIQGCHMVTLLPDGRVLYVGGGDVDDARNFSGSAVRTIKAYDPLEDRWEVFPELNEKRWYPGLTRLADGRFLIFGGGGQPERIRVETCEIFDPQTRLSTPTGSMTAAGGFSPTMLLYTGEVLVCWWPPQLYNVETSEWRNTGMFNQSLRNTARSDAPDIADHPDFSGIFLEDGRVAAIGVRRTAGETMVEIYDPKTGEWSLGTNPEVIRSMPEVLRLPNGKIFVAGGRNESGRGDVFVNEWEERAWLICMTH